jgi:DNA-binding transcriptional regulator PaaX
VRKSGKFAYYSFSQKAKKISLNASLAFHTPDWSNWNGNWWGISLSLPEKKKSERYAIQKKLIYHRFAPLHPGFWIRPYHEMEHIEDKLSGIMRHEYTRTIFFSFFSEEEFSHVPAIWNIAEINRKYAECIAYIQQCHHEFNLSIPSEALRGKMMVGNMVVKELFKDPLLPDIFLPGNWKGYELRNMFKAWDKMTTAKSKPYWKKIVPEPENINSTKSTNHGRNHKLA